MPTNGKISKPSKPHIQCTFLNTNTDVHCKNNAKWVFESWGMLKVSPMLICGVHKKLIEKQLANASDWQIRQFKNV